METDTIKKQAMAETLAIMKAEYKAIVEKNESCPPEIEAEMDVYFTLIENRYEKIATN